MLLSGKVRRVTGRNSVHLIVLSTRSSVNAEFLWARPFVHSHRSTSELRTIPITQTEHS